MGRRPIAQQQRCPPMTNQMQQLLPRVLRMQEPASAALLRSSPPPAVVRHQHALLLMSSCHISKGQAALQPCLQVPTATSFLLHQLHSY